MLIYQFLGIMAGGGITLKEVIEFESVLHRLFDCVPRYIPNVVLNNINEFNFKKGSRIIARLSNGIWRQIHNEAGAQLNRKADKSERIRQEFYFDDVPEGK